MSAFLQDTPLTIAAWRREDRTPIWVTSEEFSFRLGDETGPVFTVARGFETDLGSIPAVLRVIWNPSNPRCARAYVLHDWINKLTDHRPPGAGVWTSQLAAAVLYEALALAGEPLWSRKAQYLGVVLGIAKSEW
jgi:hypothetical protein